MVEQLCAYVQTNPCASDKFPDALCFNSENREQMMRSLWVDEMLKSGVFESDNPDLSAKTKEELVDDMLTKFFRFNNNQKEVVIHWVDEKGNVKEEKVDNPGYGIDPGL